VRLVGYLIRNLITLHLLTHYLFIIIFYLIIRKYLFQSKKFFTGLRIYEI